MRFFCEKEQLLSLLTTASRAVTNKSSMPLLECLMLHADSTTLTVTGYDLTMGIRTTSPATIEEPGKILLNARLLVDIVRKLPNDTVYLQSDPNFVTTIKCGRSVFNLTALNAEDYPALAEVSTNVCLTLQQNVLKSMIARTIFSVSNNEAKPIHTGCLFELGESGLDVVAVDGCRLSVRHEDVDQQIGKMKFVVPSPSLREIERILAEDEAEVLIFPDEKNIQFQIGNTVLVTRLIDGEFLNYHAAIPKMFQHSVEVDRQDLVSSIERVSLIASEKLKNPIRLQFNHSIIQFSCMTAIGHSYDECVIDGDIADLEIGFNNRYLLEALRAAQDDRIRIQLNGPLHPIVITPLDNDKYTYLVLPIRLKSNE